MKSGICPQCGSGQVFSGADVFGKSVGQNSIPITAFTWAGLDNYVCTECGYVESYVANREKLKKIEEKWPRPGEEQEW